jgi:DNA-binding transcriptional ArsR family regulator
MLICAAARIVFMQRLSKEQADRVAGRSRALGDPTRVRILDVLARAEQPVGRIATALDCEASAISKHLQVLFHAGLVGRRRAASTVIYSIVATDVIGWCRYLSALRLRANSGGPG